MNETKNNQIYIKDNCISNGQLIIDARRANNRRFNFTDFYYLLHRSIKNSIIREWNLQLLKTSCLMCILFFLIAIFPNDIGSDPLCSIGISDDVNSSEITELVSGAVNGKRSKAEINVNYLLALIYCFGFNYMCTIVCTFPDEIKVSINLAR